MLAITVDSWVTLNFRPHDAGPAQPYTLMEIVVDSA
jgi:hypothetical protein